MIDELTVELTMSRSPARLHNNNGTAFIHMSHVFTVVYTYISTSMQQW